MSLWKATQNVQEPAFSLTLTFNEYSFEMCACTLYTRKHAFYVRFAYAKGQCHPIRFACSDTLHISINKMKQ